VLTKHGVLWCVVIQCDLQVVTVSRGSLLKWVRPIPRAISVTSSVTALHDE